MFHFVSAREFDAKKVTENGSDYFQSLLRILGVEASIEALIRTVCLWEVKTQASVHAMGASYLIFLFHINTCTITR